MRRSFLSGHTSNTAAMTFFFAKVFTDTHPDVKNKAIVWSVAAAIPAAIGYLRFEAGRHFPTDVLAGYALGAAIGYLVPALHLSDKVDLRPMGGLGFNLTFHM